MIRGLDQLQRMITNLQRNTTITSGDLAFAMDHQAGRILDRTVVGLDYNDSSFAPYSEKGPYYYYPDEYAWGHVSRTGEKVSGYLEHHIKHLVKGGGKRTAKGVRFESYAAFKRALGAFAVNLFGPVEPHMMEKIQIEVNGAYSWFRRGSNYDQLNAPGKVVRLEINGDKGRIAAGHNEGMPMKNLPERKFFEISASDQEKIYDDLRKRIIARFEGKIGGGSVI